MIALVVALITPWAAQASACGGDVNGANGDPFCSLTLDGTMARVSADSLPGYTVRVELYSGQPGVIIAQCSVTGGGSCSQTIGVSTLHVPTGARLFCASYSYGPFGGGPYHFLCSSQ